MRATPRRSFLLLVLGVVVAGCGGGGTEGDTSAREPKSARTTTTTETTEDSLALQTVVGRPRSATEQQVVILTPDGERTFGIEPKNVRFVDPKHIASHVDVEGIAFRIHYQVKDGTEYAVSAEEVEVPVEPAG